MNQYYVYIVTNRSRTIYTGVTNDLKRRMWEHKTKAVEGFTSRYRMTQLVYFEATSDVRSAIEREKVIKGWVRRRKIALIETANPGWLDLSADWFETQAQGSDNVPSD
jgi:putative endonuclease